MKVSSDYWRRAKRIGNEVYLTRGAKTVDEQAGPAYFDGWWLSRRIFWRRLVFAVGAIPETDPGCCVDFGCGFGLVLPLLRERFQRTIGVDPMPDLSREFISRWDIDTAIGRAGNKLEIVSGLDQAGLEPGAVDLFLALDVFEHIQPLQPVLEQMFKLLAPNGRIVVSGPTESNWYRMGRRLVGFSGDYHVSDIYEVERQMRGTFSVKNEGRIPKFPPLFEILVAWK
jgi:SAM-dependent methyltransferase